jgi:hypothetical protein
VLFMRLMPVSREQARVRRADRLAGGGHVAMQ